MTKYLATVVIEQEDDGFVVSCPELQGCYTQGNTLDEALKNIREVIELHIIDRQKYGEEIPLPIVQTKFEDSNKNVLKVAVDVPA